MPWHTEKDDRCPVARPWGVVKDDDNELEGCHNTEEAAQAQMRALYANEEEMSATPSEKRFKTVELLETKADEQTGTFEALVSVFGNVDKGGDRMMKGSFANTLQRWRESGKPIPVIVSHQWDNLKAWVGKADPRAIFETERGLMVQGQLDMDDPDARKVHKLMKDGLLTGWSFGYSVPKGGQKRKGAVNEVFEVDLFEVGPTLVGMNPEAQTQYVKNETVELNEGKAVWSTAYVNDLPDSAFLYIESGGEKDSDGKTTPRSLRHFPVRDANGDVDQAHVRNALSRIPQSNVPQSAKDSATAKARRLLNSTASFDNEAFEEIREALAETQKELAELREAHTELQKTSEGRRNEEPARAKSPPDPLKEESRKAVLAVMRDGAPADVESPEPEPEPEPEMDIGDLRRESRRAALSVLKGGLDGQ